MLANTFTQLEKMENTKTKRGEKTDIANHDMVISTNKYFQAFQEKENHK